MTSAPDPLLQALEWLDEGRAVALATVVDTWGSAPRRPGSHMVIDDRGRFAGSVSGGCVEVAVIDEARSVLENGRPTVLTYGVADADAWAVGLACGGSIRVLVVPVAEAPGAMAPELLRRVAAVRAGHAGEVLALPLDGAEIALASSHPDLDPGEVEAVRRAGEGRRAQSVTPPVFLRPYLASPRVVIVGAVHIAQPLVEFARTAGFGVVLVDPRNDFANEGRFPGVQRVDLWPEEGLVEAALDPRTAVVALTHDPKLDDPALRAALASPAFYVGALGSRRTHARRRERLREAGVSDERIDRIHAPIGLDLGGRSPEEIALAIMAEIVAVLRGGGARNGA
ncbi:XdhC family protein [Gaopeijia maritima]|uniref:XdhC family protein n=1 Tax=Gaopeijia maritima TaxID=3119007 RepID=UPI00325471AF